MTIAEVKEFRDGLSGPLTAPFVDAVSAVHLEHVDFLLGEVERLQEVVDAAIHWRQNDGHGPAADLTEAVDRLIGGES